MKKAFAAATLSAALFAGNAVAETVDLTACTKDGLTATMEVEISGTVDGKPAREVFAKSFTETMREITSQQIDSYNQTVADDLSNATTILQAVQTINGTLFRNLADNLAGKKTEELSIDRVYGLTTSTPSCAP